MGTPFPGPLLLPSSVPRPQRSLFPAGTLVPRPEKCLLFMETQVPSFAIFQFCPSFPVALSYRITGTLSNSYIVVIAICEVPAGLAQEGCLVYKGPF